MTELQIGQLLIIALASTSLIGLLLLYLWEATYV